MQTRDRIFDDLSRLATGAAGTLAGMTREMEARMRERLQDVVQDENAVTREEFEAVRELAMNARTEADALKARIEALEGAGEAAAKAKHAPKA
ncbi:MAG: accessory factor UbiK family protein [Pacificimonas sp.]